MQVVPLSVGRAERSWDEHHRELAAAAGRIGSAPTGGFSAGVAAAATRFVGTCQRHTAGLTDRAGATAEGLRHVMAECLRTDRAVAAAHLHVQDRLPGAW